MNRIRNGLILGDRFVAKFLENGFHRCSCKLLVAGKRGLASFRLQMSEHGHSCNSEDRLDWAIGKDMPQMGITIGAANFGAGHEKRTILVFADGFTVAGSKKARPTGSGIKFGTGFKKVIAATNTFEHAIAFFILVGTGKGAFGPVFAGHMKLFRRQLCLPFRICFFNFCHLDPHWKVCCSE